MVDTLNEEKLAEIKEIFTLFDKDSDGLVSTQHLALMIRGLNQNPTEAEVQNMIYEVDPERTGNFDFPEFVALMARRMKDIDAEEELLEAFSVLDKQQQGFIRKVELKLLLMQSGEKLTEEEAEELVKLADPNETGNVYYKDFVDVLISRR